MLNADNYRYLRYTGPQRLAKAVHTLDGLIRGVSIDGRISDEEATRIKEWVDFHREFASRHPFNEIIPLLTRTLNDGTLDGEEQSDLLWLCEKLVTKNQYFSQVTADMQRLQGILGGVIADGRITEEELFGLRDWMGQHEHLRTCWPYDELESLVSVVLRDGVIDDTEHDTLLTFFSEFTLFAGHQTVELAPVAESGHVSGVCALDPPIEFAGRRFCLTGKSSRYSRTQFEHEIEKRGGVCSRTVTKDIDFLTIGADGNPCWAFTCYGRKVEKAIEYRKQGCRVLLVHEYDICDAFEESADTLP